MAVDFSLITFEDSGFPVELHDENACSRAVAAGRIHSSTEIIVYHTDGRIVRQKANEFSLFARLLAPPAPEPPAPAAPEPVACPPEPLEPVAAQPEHGQIVEESTLAEPSATTDVTATPPTQVEQPLTETANAMPPSPPPAQKPLKWIALGGLVLWFFAYVAGRHPADTPTSATGASEANSASSDVDPEASLERQTLYTVREVNLQQSAKSGAGVGKLPRNTAVTGVIVSGDNSAERWLRIKEGPQTGLYVWGGNLSAGARAELDTSFSGDKQVSVDTSIRAEPHENAAVIVGERTSVTAGDIVSVAGSLAGSWAEIALRKGGVGYVPMASFAATDVADEEADSPADAANGAVDSAVQPAERVSGHSLYVRNQCPYSLSIALYYRSSSGWETSNGGIWNYAANTAQYPTNRSSRLIAVSPQIYYRIMVANGEQISNFGGDINVNYGNQSLSMKKAEVLEASDGDYEISFTC